MNSRTYFRGKLMMPPTTFRSDLVRQDAIEQVPAAADDSDGADAKTGFRFG